MSRSPYAVTSAVVVACPKCKAVVGAHCTSMSTDMRDRGKTRKNVHPARRRLADEQRTREVNPEVIKP